MPSAAGAGVVNVRAPAMGPGRLSRRRWRRRGICESSVQLGTEGGGAAYGSERRDGERDLRFCGGSVLHGRRVERRRARPAPRERRTRRPQQTAPLVPLYHSVSTTAQERGGGTRTDAVVEQTPVLIAHAQPPLPLLLRRNATQHLGQLRVRCVRYRPERRLARHLLPQARLAWLCFALSPPPQTPPALYPPRHTDKERVPAHKDKGSPLHTTVTPHRTKRRLRTKGPRAASEQSNYATKTLASPAQRSPAQPAEKKKQKRKRKRKRERPLCSTPTIPIEQREPLQPPS